MLHRSIRLVCSCLAVWILLGVSGRTASATITPEAQRVVDRYLKAIGGADVVGTTTSTHTTGSLRTFGLEGRLEAWSRVPDRRATRVEIGPIKLRDGFDGTSGWRTEPTGGGKVVTLDGKDLENARNDAWFENERWLSPDQGGGNVVVVENAGAGAGETVLEVSPPHGKPRRFVFDTSGLIVRTTTKRDQQTVTTELSNYRDVTVGGKPRKMAFTQKTSVEGMPANDLFIQAEKIELNVEAPDSLFQPPAAGGAADVVRFLKQPGVATLPFEYLSRHVWLRASVNGAPPADFLYDTGASLTVIDSAYAAKIGLERHGSLQGQGAGAAGNASFGVLKTLKVESADGDGVEMKDQRIGILSLNPFLAPFFWRECAGIVGYDFISRFVSEIDYDNHVLTLYDPKTFQYSGNGKAIPMTIVATIPVVPMKVDGHAGEFRLDVGSSSTVDLHAPFVARNQLRDPSAKSVEATGGGFGGTFTTTIVRMKKIELGPYSWDDPIVSLSGATTGALASEDFAGNVGNHILERFKVTFDYDKKTLYLEPGKRFGSRDQISRSGAQLARFGDTVKVAQVLAHSPADKAGLREGDVITMVEGKAITEWTPETLRAMEEKPETKQVKVEVLRDGKKKKATVKLGELL